MKIVSTCKFSMTGQLLEDTEIVRPAPRDALAMGQLSGGVPPTLALPSKSSRHQLFYYSLAALCLAIVSRVVYLCL